MNLEIASRLVEYRKKHHLSQEDVAERIGVSRQAVSKWERVEASPDMENLIALAKLYDVSLDELILGKPKPNAESDPVSVAEDGKTVFVNGCYIHVNDEDGEDCDEEDEECGNESHDENDNESHSGTVVVEKGKKKVVINGDHIRVIGDDEEDEHGIRAEFNFSFDSDDSSEKSPAHRFFSAFPFPVLTLIAYLGFGFWNVCGGWAWGWLVFLTIPIYYSLVESVFCKKADSFAYPIAITLLYCILGLRYGWWHPAWIIFLTVPLYYFLCEWISKCCKKRERFH